MSTLELQIREQIQYLDEKCWLQIELMVSTGQKWNKKVNLRGPSTSTIKSFQEGQRIGKIIEASAKRELAQKPERTDNHILKHLLLYYSINTRIEGSFTIN